MRSDSRWGLTPHRVENDAFFSHPWIISAGTGFFRNRMFLQPPNQRQWQQKPADSNEIFVGECGQNRFILVAYETYDMYILYTYTHNATSIYIYNLRWDHLCDHIKEFHAFPFFWALQINKNPPFFSFRPFCFPPVFFSAPSIGGL